MREIKFKALSNSGDWVYGEYARIAIADDFLLPVVVDNGFAHDISGNLNTLSQYTSAKDRKGIEIYEGDIVIDKHMTRGVVKYVQSDAAFKIESDDGRLFFLTSDIDGLEVVGHIYGDNRPQKTVRLAKRRC